MSDLTAPLRPQAAHLTDGFQPANDVGERRPTLADALRGDATLVQAVRESRAFAIDLASALFGVPFVQVTRHGTISRRVPWWTCTALQASTLVVEMRGSDDDPRDLLASLDPSLLIRNTATEIEDHINRLGWRVW